MDIPVIPQMILPPESLVADVTRVWPLVRVGPLVDKQVVRFGKVSAAKLADKLFFRFGGQSPSGRLSVRSQFTEARDGATQPRAQLGQVSHLRGVILCGSHGQVGKVKTRPVLVQGWEDVGNGSLLGVEEVGGKRQSREGEARVHEALCRRHLGDGGAGDLVHVGVPQCPVVHVHGLHGTEAVQALQVVHGGGEGVHGLQEGVVGELQRWVKRDGRWQGLAPHFPECWRAEGDAPFFQDSEVSVRGAPTKTQRDSSKQRKPSSRKVLLGSATQIWSRQSDAQLVKVIGSRPGKLLFPRGVPGAADMVRRTTSSQNENRFSLSSESVDAECVKTRGGWPRRSALAWNLAPPRASRSRLRVRSEPAA